MLACYLCAPLRRPEPQGKPLLLPLPVAPRQSGKRNHRQYGKSNRMPGGSKTYTRVRHGQRLINHTSNICAASRCRTRRAVVNEQALALSRRPLPPQWANSGVSSPPFGGSKPSSPIARLRRAFFWHQTLGSSSLLLCLPLLSLL